MIEEAAVNRLLQAAADKEVAALIHHQCFAFKYPNFKPPKNINIAGYT